MRPPIAAGYERVMLFIGDPDCFIRERYRDIEKKARVCSDYLHKTFHHVQLME